MKKKSKFAFGALIGAGLGLLFAPKTGKETRKLLGKKITELFNQLKEIDVEEVKEKIEDKIAEIQKDLSNLEKEKALKVAKEKGEELKRKVEELTVLAKETGKPLVEEAAASLKVTVLETAKKVVEKLEEKPKK